MSATTTVDVALARLQRAARASRAAESSQRTPVEQLRAREEEDAALAAFNQVCAQHRGDR